MFDLTKNMLVILLTSILSPSIDTKYVSLSNKKCMTQPTLINLHPNEYSQELRYYPFAVNWYRCAVSWNILDDLPSIACVTNKIDDLNLHVFNMIKK